MSNLGKNEHRNGRSGREAGILLSPRQMAVFRLVASGLTGAQISAELCISKSVVEKHIYAGRLKLNLKNRAEVVIFCYENGLT